MDTNEPAARNDLPTEPLPNSSLPEASLPEAPLPEEPAADSSRTEPQAGPSFLRRHAVGLAVAAAALAVVVVAGGTAWGVSAAVAAGDTVAPAASAAMHAGKGSAKAAHKRADGTVGTLTAMSGDTWTIHSAAGATVTVTIGSSTKFGTQRRPAAESSFVVGDRIGALGTRTGDAVTATRVIRLPDAKHAHTPAPTVTPLPTPAPTV